MSRTQPTVLIVEDDPTLRDSLSRVLPLHGYRALASGDAEEAVRWLSSERVDLVLLDLQLPRVHGRTFLVQLRRLVPDLPVVVMSGTGTRQDAEAVMRENASDYLRKPLRMRELSSALKTALSESAAWRKISTPRPPRHADPEARPAGASGGWGAEPGGAAKASSGDPSSEAPAASEDSRPSDSPAGSAGTSRLAPLVARLQRDIVQGKLELPALDPRVARLMELARNNASVPEVVECIEGDPALVGTVLRAANSAMVRGSVAVQHVEGACVRLGQRRVCELAKQVLLKGSFSCRREPYRSILEKMWPNVIATAHLAREIGKLLELDQPEELHAMGLLHNLGELVLLFLLATVDAGDVAITKEELGAELRDSHEAFGATVAESWGLPETFVALMGNHHTKADELDAGPAELERLSIVAAWKLCLSGGLTYLSDHGTDLDPSPELDELGLELEDLEDVVQRIVAEAAA